MAQKTTYEWINFDVIKLFYHTKQWGERKDIKLAFYNFVEHKLSSTHCLLDLRAKEATSYIAKMH